ncbi:MAG: hypothetical protein LBC76_11620 [Treponema sp.]|jgi:hypothetical protein|nr:hypothetical protein [Treponema sp.]
MEKKRNPLLIASAVFGAAFVAGIITAWIYVISKSGFEGFTPAAQWNKADILALLAFQLFTAITILSFIFNLIGLVKGNSRHILIAGILYVLGINLISAPLCLTEYFDGKREIKNKLLFYTMIYAFVFAAPSIAASQFLMVRVDGSKPLINEFALYLFITTGIGLILNFIAWKTGKAIAKILAGIAYILGISTVISAILCFVSCAKRRRTNGSPSAPERIPAFEYKQEGVLK